ncbi:MAG: helix-turn-helix domain-containing protein [Chloroflexi bacterium]|nr:helix-turn-helix domain-containing protein [Chloroflexota bacterium]
MERTPEILTPEQAADYLQVDRETVYRYIRAGKLPASKLGRSYRIPKRSLDLLLWATRTTRNLSLREYTGEQIEQFLRDDELDEEARRIAERFLKSTERKGRRPAEAGPISPL